MAGRIVLIVVAASALALPAWVANLEPLASLLQPDHWGNGYWFVVWLLSSIAGLVVCEQLLRAAPEGRRWAVKPLCLGLGAMFGFDLFVFSNALLMRALDHDFWSARGAAHALAIPLLMVASARNREWTIDVAVSRSVVLRSTALLLSGLYLLALAGTGYLVRFLGGDWGKAIQTTFLFAGVVLLALLFTSGAIRSRLRVFISKNFFSYRYDYREEWLRFTGELARPATHGSVFERSVKALADLVESPGGAVWLRAEDGSFHPVGRWNVPHNPQIESGSSSMVKFLDKTGWVINLEECTRMPERYQGLHLPEWLADSQDAWLVIPLPAAGGLYGLVVLSRPRTPIDVNWEVLDLLKTAAHQAAAHLLQIRATEALVEAKQFDAFNRMSAFVVHDLKNLVAQLSLMLRNAERHAANPEFQKDMLGTVQHVVDRMTQLLMQLRSGATPVENPRPVDLVGIIERVQRVQARQGREVSVSTQPGLRALGHEDRLERVIGHLVQNAADATEPRGTISVRAFSGDQGEALVEVRDTGKGMSPEFIRDQLFKPFHTTKSNGMGIGAFESQQYVTALGGRIAVESELGRGTTISVALPSALARSGDSQQQDRAA